MTKVNRKTEKHKGANIKTMKINKPGVFELKTPFLYFRVSRFFFFPVFMFFCSFAGAQEEFFVPEEIKCYVGQPANLIAFNPARVAVAKPEIVDVYSVSANEIILEPKAQGVTTVSVWDDYGQHDYNVRVLNEDLIRVKRHVDGLLRDLKETGVKTKINEDEGRIILIGEVEDTDKKERLLSALSNVKDKILDFSVIKEERNLVKIDMQILEINRTDKKKLGINYTDSTALTDNANKAMNKITDMFATSRWSRDALDVTINHLVKEGKGKILSRPNLVCLSGREAEFEVGGQFPIDNTIVSATAGTTSTNVQFKDFGIKLKIKPVVKDEDNILIAISSDITEIDNTVAVTGNTPAFSTRNTKTELYLRNGQSLVISGLIKETQNDTVEKFPGLAEVPILGMLFRSKDFQKQQTELVILLTPSIEQSSPALKGKFSEEGFLEKQLQSQGQLNGQLSSNELSRGGLLSYIEDVKSEIISYLENSPNILALKLKLKGVVKIRMRISADGTLKDAYVINPSGSELLDNSVLLAVKNAAPFAPFPISIGRAEISADIPIICE